ncbi:RNA deprotection pyrophosphohydrolase [Falsibacillus albus]|uniref:Nucleoside triphosphatase YtkD n=1 Tax=Falsibacillus albus TaxID=2478915 RepID=A0A3L7K6F0_9BACI|nr:nucleoside triphosphatase YtkD [Falsibacillus albus]RLQ97854.1 nucleoside triphosphatase YtkD [Falsibacillus albus]
MEKFYDLNGNMVTLTFDQNRFVESPTHVFVVCRYRDQWLLTDHPKRGIEFPGGKQEATETIEQAAEREVFEETGGIVGNLVYMGEYRVAQTPPRKSFVKAIFFASIREIQSKEDYLETNGPILMSDILSVVQEGRFSFNMKDMVLIRTLEQLNKRGLLKHN